MTDLTDKWKKGELKDGKYYYISTQYYPEIIQNYVGGFYDLEDEEVEEILAPVPSYDAFMSLVSAYDNVTDENAKLKELLKEIIEDADLSYCDSDIELRINEVLR